MFLEKPLTGWGVNQMPAELARHVSGYKEKELYPHNTYLELLVEHGIFGLALYVWLMWELWRLGRGQVPRTERGGLLNQQFHAMWPVLLGIYWVNAASCGDELPVREWASVHDGGNAGGAAAASGLTELER